MCFLPGRVDGEWCWGPVDESVSLHGGGDHVSLTTNNYSATGGVVWPAARGLIHYLGCKDRFPPGFWHNQRIVELGSGTGVVGLWLAQQGANVLLTDQPFVLDLLKTNVELNRVRWEPAGGRVRVAPLSWEKFQDYPEVVESYPDVLIASDCVYSGLFFEALSTTIASICKDTTRVLFSYCSRDSTIEVEFFSILDRMGFDVYQLPYDTQERPILVCLRWRRGEGWGGTRRVRVETSETLEMVEGVYTSKSVEGNSTAEGKAIEEGSVGRWRRDEGQGGTTRVKVKHSGALEMDEGVDDLPWTLKSVEGNWTAEGGKAIEEGSVGRCLWCTLQLCCGEEAVGRRELYEEWMEGYPRKVPRPSARVLNGMTRAERKALCKARAAKECARRDGVE